MNICTRTNWSSKVAAQNYIPYTALLPVPYFITNEDMCSIKFSLLSPLKIPTSLHYCIVSHTLARNPL
jgi:hypothetical protein